MSRLGIVLTAAVALGSASACVQEEGILLAVSGDDVAILEFRVATKQGDAYILDQGTSKGGISGLRVNVSGRRLRMDPYKLLIEAPPTGPPPTLRVLVLGLRVEAKREEIYSFGVTAPPQPFVTGEVLRRSVALEHVYSRRRVTLSGRCYRVQRDDKVYRLIPDDDRDCDGSAKPKDCDDNDSAIHPGALEVCDGKDDDCDGKKAGPKVACYGRSGGACLAGQRVCKEASGGGLEGACETSGDRVAEAFCDAYDACKAPDPQGCASKIVPRRFACTLQRKADGASCGVGRVALERPTSTSTCHWKVVAVGGLKASIVHPDACGGVYLEVDLAGASVGTVVVEFFAGSGDERRSGWVREYRVTAIDAATCEDEASKRLHCSDV